MNKLSSTAACLLLLFASYAGAGQSGDYVGVSSGMMLLNSTFTDQSGSTAHVTYDSIGIPVSAYIGHQFGSGWRVEEEAFYKKVTTSEFRYAGITSKVDSDVWSIGAMTNIYYDAFHNIEALAAGPYSPYIGFGVGFANVNMSEGSVNGSKLWNSGNDTVFAYQAAIGAGIPVHKDFILDVSYRFFGTTNIHIDKIAANNFNNHNFLLGVRYFFR
jgi:opacity protein-like surface antigen